MSSRNREGQASNPERSNLEDRLALLEQELSKTEAKRVLNDTAQLENRARLASVDDEIATLKKAKVTPPSQPSEKRITPIPLIEKSKRSVIEIDAEIGQIEAELKTLSETYELAQKEIKRLRAELASLEATPALPEYEEILPAPSAPSVETEVVEASKESLETELMRAAQSTEAAENRAKDFYAQHEGQLEGHKPEYHPLVQESGLTLRSAASPRARSESFEALARAYDDYVKAETARLAGFERRETSPPNLPVIEESAIEESASEKPSQPPPPPGAEIGRAMDEVEKETDSDEPAGEGNPPEGTPHPQGGGEVEKGVKIENPKFILKAAMKKLDRALRDVKEKVRERMTQDQTFDASNLGNNWTNLRQDAQTLLRDTNPDRPAKTTDRATWYRERTAEIDRSREALTALGRELEQFPTFLPPLIE